MENKKFIVLAGFRQIMICLLFFPLFTSATVLSHKVSGKKVQFKLDKGSLNILICKPDLVEVQYSILDAMPVKTSLVVNREWKNPVDFKIAEINDLLIITTKSIKVIIDKTTNAVKFTNLRGEEILAEDGLKGKTMEPATVAGIKTYNCTTTFLSPATESLYGLGCHPEDTLSIDYKGRNQDLAIRYMTGAIPVLLSDKGYGLMWDNYSPSNFYGAEQENTRFKYAS